MLNGVLFKVRDLVCDLRSDPTAEPLVKNGHDVRRETQLLQGDCVHVMEERDGWSLVDIPAQPRMNAEQVMRPYRGWVVSHALEIGDRCCCAFWDQRGAASRGAIVQNALSYIGQPYLWGGLSRSERTQNSYLTGIDCSGLVYSCFKKCGLLLPRNSSDQRSVMMNISWKDLEPADLLFSTGMDGRIDHVMIWDGEQIIEATFQGRGVVRRISFEEKFGIGMRYFQSYGAKELYFCRCMAEFI